MLNIEYKCNNFSSKIKLGSIYFRAITSITFHHYYHLIVHYINIYLLIISKHHQQCNFKMNYKNILILYFFVNSFLFIYLFTPKSTYLYYFYNYGRRPKIKPLMFFGHIPEPNMKHWMV